MSSLCGCLRGESQPPIPLDAEIQVPGACSIGLVDKAPTRRLLGYPLFGARRPNFDFITYDNGETYVAVFRAMYRGQIMGRDSNPIPKAIYNNLRVIKKFQKGDSYGVLLDTADHNLTPYVSKMTKEDYEQLGIEEPVIDI